MIRYNEVKGDLIDLALKGHFDVIAHGCNCQCNMGAGIAPQMVKAFSVNQYYLEQPIYKGDIKKLGTIEWKTKIVPWLSKEPRKDARTLAIVNAYTQFNYGKNHKDGDAKPVDYEAITLCMRKINHIFKYKHIGLPKIGAGLAGGDWNRIKRIIQEELDECKVTIVIWDKA